MKHVPPLVWISLLLVPTTAGAEPSPRPTWTPPPADLSEGPAGRRCNEVCNEILAMGEGGAFRWIGENQNENGTTVVGFISGAWDAEEDQYCARKGIQTHQDYPVTGAAQLTEAERRAQASDGHTDGCSVTLASGESCDLAQKNAMKCNLRNSHVYQQCLALKTVDFSDKTQHFLLTMDIVVAAGCGTACALSATGVGAAAMTQVCSIGAMGAGAAEVVASLALQQSDLSRAVSGIGGVAGIAGGAAAMTFGGNTELNSTTEGNQARIDNDNAEDAKTTCTTAVIFAAMAAARGGALADMASTRKQACTMVEQQYAEDRQQSLDLKKKAEGGAGPAGFLLGGGGRNSADGGDSNDPTAPTTASDYESAMETGVRRLGATDAQLLNHSGLGRRLKDQFANLGPGILAGLKSGGMEGAMAAAVPGGAPPQLAAALAGVGKDLASKAHFPGSMMPQGGVGPMMAGGSGGASRSAASEGGFSNPFASMGAKAGGMGGKPGALDFAGAAESTDIWHANSDQNLFQIVSGRIERVQKKAEFR